jgi:hypothetical protein
VHNIFEFLTKKIAEPLAAADGNKKLNISRAETDY